MTISTCFALKEKRQICLLRCRLPLGMCKMRPLAHIVSILWSHFGHLSNDIVSFRFLEVVCMQIALKMNEKTNQLAHFANDVIKMQTHSLPTVMSVHHFRQYFISSTLLLCTFIQSSAIVETGHIETRAFETTSDSQNSEGNSTWIIYYCYW